MITDQTSVESQLKINLSLQTSLGRRGSSSLRFLHMMSVGSSLGESSSHEDLLEGSPEIHAENSVNNWINH